MAKKKPDTTDEQPADLSNLELNLDPSPTDVPEQPAEQVAEPHVGADEPALRPSVVSLAKQRGYEVSDDATDDDFWSRVESLEEKAERLAAAEAELEQQRQWRAQVEAAQAARQSEPAAAATSAPATDDDDLGIPQRPEIDETTIQVLSYAKSNGKVTEAPNGIVSTDDPNLRPFADAYNKQLAEARAYDREWTPRKIADVTYEKRIARERETLRKQVMEEVQGTLSQRDQQSYFESFDKQNAEWLFDANGARTDIGKKFAAEVNDLLARGYPAPEAMKRAQAYLQAETGETPWNKAPAKVNEPPVAKVGKFINRLKKNGSAAPAAHPVSRPSAGIGTRKFDGNISKHLDATFDALMSEQVAERI